MKKPPRPGDKPMVEACGPVENQHGREILHRCHESDEQHSGDGRTSCYQRRGQRKQSARHIALPHVESDEGKNTTPHSAGYTGTKATW